ncbi:putative reverse transcriptase domain-containing protein, partial [Tanacetum coccineum]
RGDNYDNESSDDDDDDDDVEKDEEEEAKKQLAPADPSAVPTDDPACITEFAAALPSSSPPPENVNFDVIIGMDWLSKYSAVIDCAKKIVRIPSESEILIVCGDGCSEGHRTRLNVISCTKVQKYLLKGSVGTYKTKGQSTAK